MIDARLSAIHSRPPCSFGTDHVAVRIKFLGVLAEVPNIALNILREVVRGSLDKNSILEGQIGYDGAGDPGDLFGLMRYRKLIASRNPFRSEERRIGKACIS